MAGLRFFVSSTCYDLAEERNQIRSLIKNLGHDPILSDHNEILYDYNEHTHTSCVREVSNADMVILLIGSRFGGVAIDDTHKLIDSELINEKITNKDIPALFKEIETMRGIEAEKERNGVDGKSYKAKRIGFSITHFEVLKAIQEDIPIYAFIKDKVWNFNEFYLENKKSANNLKFPGLTEESTKYLFEFIEILKKRGKNNSLFPYSNYLDIENTLKNQLALKFKDLVLKERNELREQKNQQMQMDLLTKNFEDLKITMLQTIENDDRRAIANGTIRFRRLFDIVTYIGRYSNGQINILNYSENIGFIDFLKSEIDSLEVVDLRENEALFSKLRKSDYFRMRRFSTYFITVSNGFFEIRDGATFIQELEADWDHLKTFTETNRKIILETLATLNDNLRLNREIRFIDMEFREFLIRNMESDEIETVE